MKNALLNSFYSLFVVTGDFIMHLSPSAQIPPQALGLIVGKRFENNIQGNLVPMTLQDDILHCQLFDGNNELGYLEKSPEILVILMQPSATNIHVRGQLNILPQTKRLLAKPPPCGQILNLEIHIKEAYAPF